MAEVSRLRLNLLRCGFLLMAVGIAFQMLPPLLRDGPRLELMHGAVLSMLCALGLLSVLGLIRPLQMISLLLFEITWKAIWLLRIGLPRWRAGTMDADFSGTAFACLLAVVLVPLVPWRYVLRAYLPGPAKP